MLAEARPPSFGQHAAPAGLFQIVEILNLEILGWGV